MWMHLQLKTNAVRRKTENLMWFIRGDNKIWTQSLKLQISFYLNHIFCCTQNPNYSTLVQLKAHISCYVILMPTARVKTQICPLASMCPQAKRGGKKNVYLHHAPTASSPSPVCGWIAALWRWIWSIRSINRDYCNPRGQREGTGPLRVHASRASSG